MGNGRLAEGYSCCIVCVSAWRLSRELLHVAWVQQLVSCPLQPQPFMFWFPHATYLFAWFCFVCNGWLSGVFNQDHEWRRSRGLCRYCVWSAPLVLLLLWLCGCGNMLDTHWWRSVIRAYLLDWVVSAVWTEYIFAILSKYVCLLCTVRVFVCVYVREIQSTLICH